MAGYQQHLGFSGLCGTGYAAVAAFGVGLSPTQALVAGGLTWLGGLWPDLDSSSGRPVRELMSLFAAVVPVIAMAKIRRFGDAAWFDADLAVLVAMAGYVLVRYGGAWLLGKLAVHRGMFHSLPALLIAAELTWLIYPNASPGVRAVMAGGTAVGFLSHLALDEAYSVRWDGATPRLAKSAGTAMKWVGKDWRANAVCYGLLACLTATVWGDVGPEGFGPPDFLRRAEVTDAESLERKAALEDEPAANEKAGSAGGLGSGDFGSDGLPDRQESVDTPADRVGVPQTVGSPEEDFDRPTPRTAAADEFGPRPADARR
ncbi:MAG: metal-dependent hydrolase [Planctomycetota bacterium]